MTASPTLYDATMDLGCFTVRLTMAVLQLDYDRVSVDIYPGTETESRAALNLSPDATLPILRIDAQVLCGSRQILQYLSDRHDPLGTLREPATDGPVVSQWLDFADTELSAFTQARTAALTSAGADPGQWGRARAALLRLEDALTIRHLQGHCWIASSTCTTADLAVYPAAALMRDAGLEPGQFPALQLWTERVRALVPRVDMPGVLDVR